MEYVIKLGPNDKFLQKYAKKSEHENMCLVDHFVFLAGYSPFFAEHFLVLADEFKL